jgi:uncharacterized FlaG/YvyC family protein
MMTLPDSLFTNRPAGEKMLERFINAVKTDETPDKTDMQELAKAFGRILQGENPKKVLNLERQQGRLEKKLSDLNQHEFKIAHEILDKSQGKTSRIKALKQEAADKHHVSIRTISNWIKKYQPIFKSQTRLMEIGKQLDKELKTIKTHFGNKYDEVINQFSVQGINSLYQIIREASPSEINEIRKELDELKNHIGK